jgi:DNA-binding MarR family transcriptional regulator
MSASDQKQSNKSFEDFYGNDLLTKGFTQVPNCLVTCQRSLGLNQSEVALLISLLMHDYKGTNTIYPSLMKIAHSFAKDDETVRRWLRSLEKKGYLTREFQDGDVNLYNVRPLVHKLEEHKCDIPPQKRGARSAEMRKQLYSKLGTNK